MSEDLLVKPMRSLDSAASARKFLQEQGITLYKTFTVFETRCSSFPKIFVRYFGVILAAENDRAKRAEIAKMMQDVLGPCAPTVAQLMMTGDRFIQMAIDFFSTDESAKALKEKYRISMSKIPDPAAVKPLIQKYLDSVKAFRAKIVEEGFGMDEAPLLDIHPSVVLNVKLDAFDVRNMLSSMRERKPELFHESSAEAFNFHKTDIDPVWFAFYVAVQLAEVNTKENFMLYQRGIYNLCKVYRDETDTRSLLKTMIIEKIFGMEKILKYLTPSTDNDLVPWILKPSRLYDAAAPICPCDLTVPSLTLDKPSYSWRYLLCLNFEKEYGAVNFVTTLWNLEDMANEGRDKDIRLSEMMLHQMLEGINFPFACTNFIKSNAHNVTLV